MGKRKTDRKSKLLKQRRRREKKAGQQFKSWVEERRKEYSQEWKVNAQYFQKINSYDWMCEAVTGKEFLVEVGCGTGESTLALASKNHRIVVVEENPDCCLATANYLKENGIDIELVPVSYTHLTLPTKA